MIHGLIRGSVAIAAACLIAFRLGTDISPESLTGVGIGLLVWLLMMLSLVVGRHQGSRRASMNPGKAAAGDLHVPIGLLTVVAAMAHWHPRWRDFSGALALGLLWVVVLALVWPPLRRFPAMRRAHRFGAYLLVAVASVHGIQALFFVQN